MRVWASIITSLWTVAKVWLETFSSISTFQPQRLRPTISLLKQFGSPADMKAIIEAPPKNPANQSMAQTQVGPPSGTGSTPELPLLRNLGSRPREVTSIQFWPFIQTQLRG